MKWIKEIKTWEMYRMILGEYLSHLELLNEKINRFQTKLNEMSQEETYKTKIDELRCFKGIGTASAMNVYVEVSDFNRLPNAKAFTTYCGLQPRENSSEDKSHRLSITKQGNVIIWTTLIECAKALVKGTSGVKGMALKARQNRNDVKVIDYADKAITAVVREQAFFI